MKKVVAEGTMLGIKVLKRQARFKRVRAKGPDAGIGEFFLLIDIAAQGGDVYVPLSIASGKKPTGFVYQLEGPGAQIETTEISVGGSGVTEIVLGTLRYAKIPAGKTAEFRILVTMRGRAGKEYAVVVNCINYKLLPADARYQKYLGDLRSETLRFS